MIKVNSIRFKIAVYYTVILGLILVAYTGILGIGLRYALYQEMDNSLMVKAQEISNAINSYLDVLGYSQKSFNFAVMRVIRQEGAHPNQDKIVDVERTWLAIWDKDSMRHDFINFASSAGEILVNSPNLDSEMLSHFMKGITANPVKAVEYRDIDFTDHSIRLVSIPYRSQNKKTYIIQVGVSRKSIHKILYERLVFSAISIPFLLLLSSFFGIMIARRILRPVMEVTRIARNITYKDLSIRVKTKHVDQELKYLVDAFNEMISRLDTSFHHIAEFSSNVAHELKTPLTIIRGESELTLMKERDRQEYERVIRINLEETERLLKIVEDLLLLSKLDYQPEIFTFTKFDFSVFIQEVYEQAKKMALPKNITVTLHSVKDPMLIQADQLHLRRLFINLVSNAIKYTTNNGTVDIIVKKQPSWITVSVSDTGIGIAPKDIGKVFDRFFRVPRRVDHVNVGGSGLGLSIAQSIAKIHHTEITVQSQPGKGSTFSINLPL